MQLICASFTRLADPAVDAAEYFRRRLDSISPDAAALFPADLTAQRELFADSLTRIRHSLESGSGLAEQLATIGRESRKFGATDRHFAAFMLAMEMTARHFDTAAWTAEVEASWQCALDYMAGTMRAAAAADAVTAPAWWVAEIAAHELRAPGVAVLQVAPDQPLPYRPGQYVWVQVTKWPQMWRRYSVATRPRPSGLIELHVRAVPGGLVSNALVYHSAIGDTVILGAADGAMRLADSDRDLLCIAGGTGLAPIKAIVEQAISEAVAGRPRKITLFFGARQNFDLYDLRDLQLLESAYPGLRVIPVLSDAPGDSGCTGLLPDVVSEHHADLFTNCEAYICGPPGMVSRTATLLAGHIPAGQIHHDPF